MPVFGIVVYTIEIIASITTYLCNGCLLYCVLKNWKPGLKRLNLILIQNIVLDCTYGLFPVFTGVWISIIDEKLYIVSTGLVKNIDYRLAGYAYCMYCSMLSLCMYAFPMQFYLRYKTLCKSDELSTLFHSVLWTCLLFSCFGTFVCLAFCYDFKNNLPTYDMHAADAIANFVTLDESTPFAIGDTSSLYFASVFGFACFSFIASSIIVAYYAYLISIFVLKTAAMTTHFKHLYMMLHRTLITQAVIFFCLPSVLPFRFVFVLCSKSKMFTFCLQLLQPSLPGFLSSILWFQSISHDRIDDF